MDTREAGYRRTCARIAGLMFWLVFVFDFAGMSLHATTTAHWLSLVGSLLTIPLAYGLYVALAPVHKTIAMTAFGFRLGEIVLTLTGVTAAFPGIHTAWTGSPLLQLASWDRSTSFSAFLFTIGSTLFFYLFFRSPMIPVALSVFGILASIVAFAACLTHLIHPAFPAMTMWAWVPLIPAELVTGAWLLIRSVRYPTELAPVAIV